LRREPCLDDIGVGEAAAVDRICRIADGEVGDIREMAERFHCTGVTTVTPIHPLLQR